MNEAEIKVKSTTVFNIFPNLFSGVKYLIHSNLNRFILFITIFLCCNSVFSQNGDNYAGARSAAMGHTGLTLQDTWAVFNNPAAISGINSVNVGIFYENRFLMKETGYGALAFTAPLLGGNIGFGLTHFGFELFQQNKFVLGYAQQLFRNFSMGIQLDYFSTRQSEYYGNFNAISFEFGFLFRPTEKFAIGTYVFNPLNFSYFEDNDVKMPVAIKLGLSYLFSKRLLIAIETGKAINGEIPVFKTGIEYKINQHFAFRGGISMKPIEYTFGLGYNTNGFNFDLAFAYHQILGSTPKLSIHYAF